MRRLLLIAARSLWQAKRRTLLLGSAFASVMVLFVLLTSITSGIRQTLVRRGTAVPGGHVVVRGFYKIVPGHVMLLLPRYRELQAYLAKSLPGVRLGHRIIGGGRLISPHGSVAGLAMGVNVRTDNMVRQTLALVKGDIDQLSLPKSAVIFQNQARRLAASVGDTLTLAASTTSGARNAVDVQVRAIVEDIGFISRRLILVSDDALRTALQIGASAASAVCIKLRDRQDSARVAEKVRALLIKRKYRLAPALDSSVPGRLGVARDASWTGLRLDVSIWQTDLAVMAWAVGLVRGIGGAIVAFLLMITIFGVTNALWLSIRERTREIGTLRAIGMSRTRVLLLIMFEAALLALFGAAVGVALGGAIVAALSNANIELGPAVQYLFFSQTLNLRFEPRVVAGGVLLVVFVTAIFALYPAYRAARLRPATAIRHTG